MSYEEMEQMSTDELMNIYLMAGMVLSGRSDFCE